MKKVPFNVSPIKETYQFTFNDIIINVEVDYWQEEISLMEHTGNSKFKNKKWLFAGRRVSYMKGWRKILEAMSEATKHAEKKLNDYNAIKEATIAKMIKDKEI